MEDPSTPSPPTIIAPALHCNLFCNLATYPTSKIFQYSIVVACAKDCQPVFLQCRLAVRYPHACYTTLTLLFTYAARLYPTAYA